MSVATSAISSMNYFFLKTVTGKIDVEEINEEVSIFISALADNTESVSKEALIAIKTEITDGNYFEGMSIMDVRAMINQTVHKLTGVDLPQISQFYANILIEGMRIQNT